MESETSCIHEQEIRDLNSFNGNVDNYFDYLSDLFEEKFIKNTVYFKSKPVEVSNLREENGRLERFWHIISNTDYRTHEKTYPNLKRCAAVHYIAVLLQDCFDCENYITFDRKEKNKLKTYVWCKSKNIMIVLECLTRRYRFITCFIVNKQNVKVYQKRYEESLKT